MIGRGETGFGGLSEELDQKGQEVKFYGEKDTTGFIA